MLGENPAVRMRTRTLRFYLDSMIAYLLKM